MKRTAALFVCIFMVCVFTVGCKVGGGIKLPGGICTDCEHYATLQGTIMDAVTGEHLGGKDMEIYLIQGATVRTPTSFNNGVTLGGFFNRNKDNATAVLTGEYSFTQIPIEVTDAGGTEPDDNKDFADTFKMIVVKEGYQRFEGEVSLKDVDTKIGNIYLFPIDFFTPDYKFTVVYQGKPVPNATVALQPAVASNLAATETGNVLTASPGYLESIIAVTDAQGQVIFDGAKLAAGAAYNFSVTPTLFEGVQLEPKRVGPYIIGLSDVTDIVQLDEMVPGTHGLYVKSISNSVDEQVVPAGTLTIVFSRAVTLQGNILVNHAASTLGSGNLDDTTPVNASLSTDGLTLTLTPNWTTAPGDTETGLDITYTSLATFNDALVPILQAGGYLSLVGYPGHVQELDSLKDEADDTISLNVLLSNP